MLWSKLFIPTLRAEPADVESPARRLMTRAGYLRKSAYLCLGQRVISRIVAIAREEMNAIGAQEFIAASPVAPIASELQSYKQVPQIWYRIHDLTMDAWSFELAQACPARFSDAIRRIFDRCELKYAGGKTRFLAALEPVPEPSFDPPAREDPEGNLRPEEFHTPGQKTIADVAAFTALPETSQMKSVVMVADGRPVMAILRGDHSLRESTLRLYLSATELRPAQPAEIREWFGADAGSLGPVGVRGVMIVADTALMGRRNMICGANRNDYHLRNVTPGKDFAAEFWDLRETAECGADLARLTWRQSALTVTNQASELQPLLTSANQLHIDRLLDSLVDQHHDKDGIALPPSIAPFAAVVTPINFNDPAQRSAAATLHAALEDQGVESLLDDRDERPGVKFKDADLIGVPYRITVGKKLAQGQVEVVNRRTHESTDVPVEEAAAFLAARIK